MVGSEFSDEWDAEIDAVDAEVEDTIHCHLCRFRTTCGSTDFIVTATGHCVCIECAKEITRLYREDLVEAGLCEHGVNDGDYCPECNAEYHRARREHGDE